MESGFFGGVNYETIHNTRADRQAIELGFEKPKFEIEKQLISVHGVPQQATTIIGDYTIGELIEMLPTTIVHEIWWGEEKGMDGFWGLQISTNGTDYMWTVDYTRDSSAPLFREADGNLIDALYAMVLTLKEEGMI